MSGVSRLLGLMAITELQNVQSYLTSELSPSTDTSKLLELSATALRETNNMVSNPTKTYSTFSSKIIKLQVVEIKCMMRKSWAGYHQ